MKEVIIIGTGNLAKLLAIELKKKNYSIKVFLDEKSRLSSGTLEGVLIDAVDNIKKYSGKNSVIWIAKKKMFTSRILCELYKKSIETVFVLDNDFLYEKNKVINNRVNEKHVDKINLQKQVVLGYLETNIFDGCNLNCAGCTHFSGLIKESRKIDDVLLDIKLLENIKVLNFRLLGGEPFLLKNIDIVMNQARKTLGNRCKIEIVTNGLLLSKLENKVVESIKNNNIKVNISVYEPTKKNIEEIVSFLNEREINYCFNDESKETKEVIKTFHTKLSRKRENNGERSCLYCYNNSCLFLRDKKIFRCAYPALIDVLNETFGFGFISEEGDYIDFSSEISWKKIERLIYKASFCGYCQLEGKSFEWNHDIDELLFYIVE